VPTLASIDPADGAGMIYRNKPVIVRLQRADSNDYQKVETTQGDFQAGTLTDVAATGQDDLTLLKQLVDDFEADTIGQVPGGWTVQAGSGYTVQSIDSQKALKCYVASGTQNAIFYTAAGSLGDTDFYMDFQPCTASRCSPIFRASGLNWYRLMPMPDSSKVRIYRMSNWAGTSLAEAAFTMSAGTWYTIRVQAVGSTLRAKVYQRGTSEPSSWTITATDSNYAAGNVGVENVSAAQTNWFDNVKVLGQGDSYTTSGNRVSPAYSLATVAIVGGTWIEWDASVPAGCTFALEASVNGTAWYACTNGAPIPTILTEGTNVSAVSLYLRESMTGDGVSTPALHDVTVTFRPVEPRSVEVTVNGVACNVAEGTLDYWNTAVKSGSVIVDCYKDVYFATLLPWWDYGPAEVEVLVAYKGSTISTTTFETESWETFQSGGWFKWFASAIGGAFDGPMQANWHFFVTTLEPWLPRGEFHYTVGGAIRSSMDFYYWIAHPFRGTVAAGALVGQRTEHRVAAGAMVMGWKRNSFAAGALVQGWFRGMTAAGAFVATRYRTAVAAAGALVAKRFQNTTAAGAVVYEVNRNTTLEVQVISEGEAAALDESGASVE